jgi:uncharacterized protein (TIGR03435 family)
MKILSVLFAVAWSLPSGFSQSRPSFDVASVKIAPPDLKAMGYNTSFGKIAYRNLPMKTILSEAYRIKEYQISGPRWLDNLDPRYVIEARCQRDAPEDQVRLMLQSLLAERFHLTVHWQKKSLPVYVLETDSRGGPRLKKTTQETPGGFSNGSSGPGGISGNLTLPDLADMLTRQLERPVVDHTGIDGMFDIALNWKPNELLEYEAKGGSKDGVSLFTALRQQLGLRLVPKKADIDLLIIDHLDKTPTAN